MAGGLNPQLQLSLADRLRPVLIPSKGKGSIKPNPNELAEMVLDGFIRAVEGQRRP